MRNTPNYQLDMRHRFDEGWATQYRQFDDRTTDEAIVHYGRILTKLSSSFEKPIDALDVGCGTGRYFHCLRSVRKLVGFDLSPYMLEQAKSPAQGNKLEIGEISLFCGDVLSASLPDSTFDLIYSIGVFGEYSPIDHSLLASFLRLLRPRGILLVTAVDTHSRVSVPEAGEPSLSRRIVRKSFPYLPNQLRALLNRKFSPFYVTRAQVELIFKGSGFLSFEVQPYVHTTGWLGTHFDCFAYKGGEN